MEKVIVTLEMREPISVSLEVDNSTDNKKVLELAKKKWLEKVTEKFPPITYSIHSEKEGKPLTRETSKVGMVVQTDDLGYGVIIKINPKTIKVAFKQGVYKGSASAFKLPLESYKVKDVVWDKKDAQFGWYEGDVAYLANIKENKVQPVVITGERSNKLHITEIDGDKSYSLPTSTTLLKATEKEAKEMLK